MRHEDTLLQMVSMVHFLEEGRVKLLMRFLYSVHFFASLDDGTFSPFRLPPKKHHGCKKRQHRAANRTW